MRTNPLVTEPQINADQGGDSFSPNYLTVNPVTGAVGANFTGGLTLSALASAPDAASAIKWLDINKQTRSWLYNQIFGGNESILELSTGIGTGSDPPSSDFSLSLDFLAGVSGVISQAYISARDLAHGLTQKLILDSAGSSDFLYGQKILEGGVDTSESTASLVYVDLTTLGPTLTIPKTGNYICLFEAEASNNTVGDGAAIAVSVAGGAANDSFRAVMVSLGANVPASLCHWRPIAGTLGDLVRLKYRATTGGTAQFNQRRLILLPLY